MRSDTEEGGAKGCKARRKSSKGAADGLGFQSSSYGIVRGRLGARGWLSSPLLFLLLLLLLWLLLLLLVVVVVVVLLLLLLAGASNSRGHICQNISRESDM